MARTRRAAIRTALLAIGAVGALWQLAGPKPPPAIDHAAFYRNSECAIYHDNLALRLSRAGDAAGAAAAEKRRNDWTFRQLELEIASKASKAQVSPIEDRAAAEHERQMAQGDWAAYEKRYAAQCS